MPWEGPQKGLTVAACPWHLESRGTSTLCPRQRPTLVPAQKPRGRPNANSVCCPMGLGLGEFLGGYHESLLGSRVRTPHPHPQVPRGVNTSFAPVLSGSQTWELRPCPTLCPVLFSHTVHGLLNPVLGMPGRGNPNQKIAEHLFQNQSSRENPWTSELENKLLV